MTSFRGFVIVVGLVILGLLWGSFYNWYHDVKFTSTPIRLYLWSNLVAITFIIVVRIWDMYHDHKDDPKL